VKEAGQISKKAGGGRRAEYAGGGPTRPASDPSLWLTNDHLKRHN